MPRRRRLRSTWGSNEDAGNGKRRLRFWADLGDGRGYMRHSITIEGTRRDGGDVLAELRVAHRRDAPRTKPATVRDAYLLWWLPEASERLETGNLAQATYNLYSTMWRLYIEPTWGEKQIDAIRPMDVQEWLLGLTHWNAVNAKSLAGSIAEKAVIMDAAKTNPFRRDYRMPKGGETREKAVWKLETVHSACAALRGTAVEIPAILCGFGSCRVGEASAVRPDEVDLTDEGGMMVARIPISRQLVKEGVVKDELKNPQSVRTVCIPEPWSVRVAEIARERMADGLPWLNDDGTGQPVPRMRMQRAWNSQFKEGAALSEYQRIPMRNLRNSWETYMRWELGVAPDIIDSMMGHAGKGVRERHYDRPVADMYAQVCADAFADFSREAKVP